MAADRDRRDTQAPRYLRRTEPGVEQLERLAFAQGQLNSQLRELAGVPPALVCTKLIK
jgi:hypothetical protein